MAEAAAPSIADLKEQACRVRDELPELYEFLKARDDAMQNLISTLVEGIPNPDPVPIVPVELPLVVWEPLKPQSEEACRKWLEPDGLSLLPTRIRVRMHNICRHGVAFTYGRIDRLAS